MTNTRIKEGQRKAHLAGERKDNGWLSYSEEKFEGGSGGNQEVTTRLSNYKKD